MGFEEMEWGWEAAAKTTLLAKNQFAPCPIGKKKKKKLFKRKVTGRCYILRDDFLAKANLKYMYVCR